MHIEIKRVHSLPRLAWCASIKKGEDAVVVYAGPWVEARNGCFFEGAWNGAFQEYGFDKATVLSGSGGRLYKDGILFASPSHLSDCLVSIHLGKQMLVSNSIVFLLVQADDMPDVSYPFYINDLLRLHQTGFSKKPKRIRTEKKNDILFHFSCNFFIGPDLSLLRQEKNVPSSPQDFKEYVELLEKSLRELARNASDPSREFRYELLTTISRGYDSTACSVIARRAGCKQAVTFARVHPKDKAFTDSGKSIAERLGLGVTEYDPDGYKHLPGFPESEFSACSVGMDVCMSVMEDQLVGKVLVTGRANMPWFKWRVKSLFSLSEPTNLYGAGVSLNEFRLRVGFLHCPILYLTSRDRLSIQRITRSPEMNPWSIGGSYDRPISRRILEGEGIPRLWFGQKKMAGAYSHIWKAGNMSKKSRDDFLRFYKSGIPSISIITRIKFIFLYGSYFLYQACSIYLKHIAGFLNMPWYVLPDMHCPTKHSFIFHWGFFRIRDRYRIDSRTTSSLRKNRDRKTSGKKSRARLAG